jgi:hypothetical protein
MLQPLSPKLLPGAWFILLPQGMNGGEGVPLDPGRSQPCACCPLPAPPPAPEMASLLSLQEENQLLQQELSRVEDLLAQSRAERDELAIKYNAVSERVGAAGAEGCAGAPLFQGSKGGPTGQATPGSACGSAKSVASLPSGSLFSVADGSCYVVVLELVPGAGVFYSHLMQACLGCGALPAP